MLIKREQSYGKLEHGDYRIETHFPIIPVYVRGKFYWLCIYKEVYQYIIRDRYGRCPFTGTVARFSNIPQWELISVTTGSEYKEHKARKKLPQKYEHKELSL